jgi:hypothetical protein
MDIETYTVTSYCKHVGEPPSGFDDWETITICFHNFASYSNARIIDNYVLSGEFHLFGHVWELGVFPGGCADDEDAMMSIFSWNKSHTKVDISYMITVIDREEKDRIFRECSRAAVEGFVHKMTLKRDELLEESTNICNKGTLVFKVKLSLADS